MWDGGGGGGYCWKVDSWMVVDGQGGFCLYSGYSGGLLLVSVLPVLSGNNCT